MLDNSTVDYIFRHYQRFLTLKEIGDLKKLKDGYELFRIKIAGKILKDHSAEIYFNNCPKCGRLARTPLTRQCRYCGHSWRE